MELYLENYCSIRFHNQVATLVLAQSSMHKQYLHTAVTGACMDITILFLETFLIDLMKVWVE